MDNCRDWISLSISQCSNCVYCEYKIIFFLIEEYYDINFVSKSMKNNYFSTDNHIRSDGQRKSLYYSNIRVNSSTDT